jgi:predicted transcriptional regulator
MPIATFPSPAPVPEIGDAVPACDNRLCHRKLAFRFWTDLSGILTPSHNTLLLTPHARVLLCVASQTSTRLRDIADCAGMTERSAHRMVEELEQAGYLTRHRLGRRNFYEVHAQAKVETMPGVEVTLGDLLGVLLARESRTPS